MIRWQGRRQAMPLATRVLLSCADGLSINDVMRRVGVGRPMIYECIDKALAAVVAAGLKDACHRPHDPEPDIRDWRKPR